MPEGPTTIKKDIADVTFKMLELQEDVRRRRLFKILAWLGAIFTLMAVAGSLVPIDIFAPRLRHTALFLWINIGCALVLVAIWTAIGVYLVRSRINDYELDRRLAEYRESRKSLLERLSTGEDIAVLKRYREDVVYLLEEYRRRANYYRRVHNAFQTVVIVGAIITTSVTSAAGQVPAFRLIAPIISIFVGISAGMTGYFKFRERSLNLQQTADDIEHEYNAVELRIEGYRRAPDEREALIDFAEKVERLKDEQRKREQQLEQPPEVGNRQNYTGRE